METVCKRVVFGKLINAGQTCIAPDYLLCSHRVQHLFVECFKKVITELYGYDPKYSSDLGRIINDKHFRRITDLMRSSGKVAAGGDSDADQRYIAPTVLVNVSPEDPVMVHDF